MQQIFSYMRGEKMSFNGNLREGLTFDDVLLVPQMLNALGEFAGR